MAEEKNSNSIVPQSKVMEGDMIKINRGSQSGKKGKVVTIRENSVIVEVGYNTNTGEPIMTVVNHKNYKLIK